ncbi:iron(III) transport system ATP-binding protein [Natronobacillus azotifigens]|uniref:Carnitine transport ATP-binding protein OpuCA n=1 Tax=Natronobacillus azotifigens TaxID=472978 RepID=A0A9J6RAF1_9BACI|nr:ABC transporter ATP-binding protein [Natronobacillus azotifigens]MCZ0702284.1 ABC transporter ATP-binding protein [Natronobacillus azotifigens]
MSFIQFQNVTKYYNRAVVPAVDHLNLEISKGEIITLLGPSGCGKTTTLRMLAGFEQPTAGEIRIGDEVVYDDRRSLPPEKRGIGMVFQDYALFPHLTIEKNVMFGLNKWKARDKKKRVQEVLELVGLGDFGQRLPSELSGGQQQRVALARALAPNPKVILMDEPFSNLDAGLREKMRFDVTNILRKANATAIIVTHDQKDAFTVSDRVVVMNEGVIQQIAAPKEIYRCPVNCFVAQFVGKTNLISGTLCPDLKHVETHFGRVCVPQQTNQESENVVVSIRPEGCRLAEYGRYAGIVEQATYSGEYQELHVRLQSDHTPNQPMVIYAPIEQDIEIGSAVTFNITPELVALVN